jgi:hypothetical protein
MKIRDLMTALQEGKGRNTLPLSAVDAVPGAQRWDALDNSSPYHSYRFGVALAGMPDYPMNLEGPSGQKMVTVSYSEADEDIIKATGRHLGFQGVVMTPRTSKELSDTEAVSPVSNWNKKATKKKAKKD